MDWCATSSYERGSADRRDGARQCWRNGWNVSRLPGSRLKLIWVTFVRGAARSL